MKVNSSAGLERYQSFTSAVKNGEKPKTKGMAANTDKVTISDGAAARAEANRLSAALAAEVEGAASPERLEELRGAVAEGSYYVASEEIADAILDVKV